MIPAEIYEQTVLAFLAPVRPYLDDPSVSEIMINGPNEIYIERKGCLEKVPAKFSSKESLLAAIRNLSQYVGKVVSEENPILEGRLPDGSRVEAVLPPASPDGPHIAIRRFAKETLTAKRLVDFGSMTPLAAQCLEALVAGKTNLLVAGGTGSGKTSMLNALSAFIPEGERVVTIEDSREVQFQREHVVSFEARPADARGKGAVSIRDLFRATLRLRPDRVVVGEIRGGEAMDIVQAMTSGHGGCMGTLHATYPRDTLTRLETMCLMSSIDMPLHAIRPQIASAVQIILQCSRLADGSRKVTHITEVTGFDADTGKYAIRDLFVREYQGTGSDGKLASTFEPTGAPLHCEEQLREHGLEFPKEYARAAPAHARRKGALQ